MHYKFLSNDFLCNVFVINAEWPSTSGAAPAEEIQRMPELDETIAVITEPTEEDSRSSSMGQPRPFANVSSSQMKSEQQAKEAQKGIKELPQENWP